MTTGTLTVRETLQFSAELRLPSKALTPLAKRARVEVSSRESYVTHMP
jgi:hypothetical protein